MKFFTKSKKSIISVVLCLIMLSSFALPVFAAGGVSVSAGIIELRDQFRTGESKSEDAGTMSYQYYTPLEYNVDSTTKYPVVIFLGENDSSTDKKLELKTTDFPLWSSSEYQSRFYNAGGAHLLFPKIPKDSYGMFEGLFSNTNVVALKNMIDDYIEKNAANVDSKRIYLVSWSTGCKYAVKLAANYTGYFSSLVLIAPEYEIQSEEYAVIKDLPIWLFACRSDSQFSLYGEATWDEIKNRASDPYKVRYTRFDSYMSSATEHAAYDMHLTGASAEPKTINARNQEITFANENDGIISWLSKQGSDYGEDCDCNCHTATGFLKIVWLLTILISMMFKIEANRVCACGKAHY